MCKYVYRTDKGGSISCGSSDFNNSPGYLTLTEGVGLRTALPIDEAGYCIFHSHNYDWKYQNQCWEWFTKLLEALNDNTYIQKGIMGKLGFDFRGFIMVGSKSASAIRFDGVTFAKSPDFTDSTFIEDLIIENVVFQNGCLFEKTIFKKTVTIRKTNFADTTIFNFATFEDHFYCRNSDFQTAVIFSKATFKKSFFLIENCSFGWFVEFDRVSFENSSSNIVFDKIKFEEGAHISFVGSKFEGMTTFNEIVFGGNADFTNCEFNLLESNNPIGHCVSFKKIHSGSNSKIKFMGRAPYSPMFKGTTFFGFDKDFSGIGSFSNVDFANIDIPSRRALLLLAKEGRMVIGNGCIIEKLNMVQIFIASKSNLNEERDFIESVIRQKNDALIIHNIYIAPIRWEHWDAGNELDRKQEEFNNLVTSSEYLIVLFWGDIGKYTKEELEMAFQSRRNNNYPYKIYLFNKVVINESASAEFLDEIESLKNSGQFIVDFSDKNKIQEHLSIMFDGIIEKYRTR